MRIEVTQFIENDDGSAYVELQVCQRVKEMLMEKGFITILKEAMDTDEDCK